jgi:hypothetical protein
MSVRALVARDDVDLRDTWGHFLGQVGHSCLTASSGSEAMQARDTEEHRVHDADATTPSKIYTRWPRPPHTTPSRRLGRRQFLAFAWPARLVPFVVGRRPRRPSRITRPRSRFGADGNPQRMTMEMILGTSIRMGFARSGA